MIFSSLSALAVWRWTKRVILVLVIGAVLVLAVIAGYNQVVVWHLSRTHPLPGRLVEVNGRKMHLYCAGTGTPTVVLESGMGGGLAGLVPCAA
jgi:hypothetical protein